MEGHRDNHIDVDPAWKGADHEVCEWSCQCMFASVFERTDGFSQWRKIGEEGPGSLKIRRLFLTLLALMIGSICRSRQRDKRLIAAAANRLLKRTDCLPTRVTEEGHRVSTEWMAAGTALDRQHKPEGLTAPSDEPILCVFT